MTEEDIFHEALSRTAGDRASYVESACAGDAALQAAVEALLRANVGATGFLECPPIKANLSQDSPNAEPSGTVLGQYKLIEPIGEGGMGAVWMAQQQEPIKRPVAVKLIRPGMDSKQVLARFDAERQALALMDHPNIAKVYDAGTAESGRPYFVMELVKGTPITRYCDDQHLTPRQRLELFIPVCQAIQHAHQKGIIHRDLKPSNVLVALYDGRPAPKVIDFGVAKATGVQLTEESLHTGFGAVVGTIEYMSPEQASFNQLDVDTRSDIYSLGILLYELLTGNPPFTKRELESVGLLESLRVIREQEPTKPSAKLSTAEGLPTLAANRGTEPAKLTKLVRGELDWIVMKALEKDRNRRYETANDFAMDVQRYLADEPVHACPPSATYRFRKFARRNLGALATGAALAILLLASSSILAISNIRIDRALGDRTDALEERNRAYGDLQNEQKRVSQALDDVTRLFGKLQVEQKQTRRALYFHSVALADREWWLNNVDKAEEILDQCAVEDRGWEWHFLKRRCYGSTILCRNGARPVALAFSPDGERLACCFQRAFGNEAPDSGVKVWETQTGKELLNLTLPIQYVSQIAFSPDGRQLAVPTFDKDQSRSVVRILDSRTGAEVRTFAAERGQYIRAVAFRPDGKQLAIAGERLIMAGEPGIRLVDLDSGVERILPEKWAVFSLSYSIDGKRLATAGTKGRIWDTTSGKELFQLEVEALYWTSFSPDGRRLVTADRLGHCRTIDPETGKSLLTLSLDAEPTFNAFRDCAVAFNPDSQQLLTAATDRTLRVLDAATGKEQLRHRGHGGRISCVAWSRTNWLASADDDGSVRLWPPTKLRTVASLRPLAISPEGVLIGRVELGRDQSTQATFKVLEPKSLLEKNASNFDYVRSRFDRDGRSFVARWQRDVPGVRYDLYVYPTAPDQAIALPRVDSSSSPKPALRGDGRQLAVAARGRLVVWDLPSGEVRYSVPISGPSDYELVYSRDGRRLGGVFRVFHKENVVKVWDAANGSELRAWTIPRSLGTLSVAFSSDGERLVATGFTNDARIFDVRDNGPMQLLATNHPYAAFLSAGKRLVTWTGHERNIQIWDIETRRELLTLRGQNVLAVNDDVLTVVDAKGAVQLFDGRPWQKDPAPSGDGPVKGD
jgi:serine/threonine protein kinase/WD40 repeat protein